MATTWVEKRDRRREVSLHDRVVCPTAHGIGFARAGGPANAHPLSEELFWEGQALRAMNRHQPRILTLMIAAIAVAIAVKGRGPQAEIRARAFVLVDDSGEVLARLAKVKDGPLLVLHARRAGADVLIGSIVDDAGIGITTP